MRKRKQAKSNKISKFGVWEWDDWTRDTPTLICDPIDNHGVYFAELIPSWFYDVNDRGEYEWDGSFDPETEPTNWTLEIYDTEFGATGDWTEFVDCTAREAMEEADDFIAKFITRENLVGNGPYTLARRNAMRKRRNKTAEITWGEASDVLEACVDKAVEYFKEYVDDGMDVDDAVSEAVYGAIDDSCMYYTDALAMIWACGAYDDAIGAAIEKISDEVYNEFYQKIDPEDYRKEGRRKRRAKKARRANMRKRAYNYWESMEFNGDEAVEFRDIIPINVYEGKSEYTDGGYVFDGELYTDDVTWDEYDEDESYTWGFLILEDGIYEWGDYSGTFTGTEWEAQDWADGLIQRFIDDYKAGLITPQGIDYYSQYFD